MHIYRINTEEIPHCPPVFDNCQCLSDDEIIDILLFSAPKSWQQEMDHQGFDPLTKTPTELAEFMEHIEMSEDINGDKKVAAVTKKGNNKKKANGKENLVHSTVCCMATTTPTTLRSARHQWRKLRS